MGNQDRTALHNKPKSIFLEITGWLIPLVVSGPSLFIWAGLMTMPLIVYLGIMFLSLFNPSIDVKCCDQPYLLTAIEVLLLGGPYWPDKAFSILGIFILVYSTVYLNLERKKGLVTSGPYRYVRNPQYFGAILFIINMTSRSYREVLGDKGWIGPQGTLLIWLATLAAYILLALVEEAHLTNEFGQEYIDYKNRTALLIPFAVSKNRSIEMITSVLVPLTLLWGLVWLNRVLFP